MSTSTAIITGASSGIGEDIARRFLKRRWSVISLARRACPIDGVASVPVDLRDRDVLTAAMKDLIARLPVAGRVCLVHNAAECRNDAVGAVQWRELEDALAVNVFAAQITAALLPRMGAGSSIIYIGSTLSEKAVPGAYSYVVSKHAVIGMMRATCQDLAGGGVHTVAVCPGITDTPMLRDRFQGDPATLASLEQISTFGRLVKTREVSRVVYAAAINPVLNGAVIHANLGQVRR